jgi:hypothetical protein
MILPENAGMKEPKTGPISNSTRRKEINIVSRKPDITIMTSFIYPLTSSSPRSESPPVGIDATCDLSDINCLGEFISKAGYGPVGTKSR